MSTINQKLGLRPKSKVRAATHATALARNTACPNCSSNHVIRTQSRNGQKAGSHMCCQCSTFFTVNQEDTMADDTPTPTDETPTPQEGSDTPSEEPAPTSE